MKSEAIIAAIMGLAIFTIASIVLGVIGLSIYGLILAFSANIFLGLLILIIEPLPLVFGFAMFFLDVNLAEKIMAQF